MSLNIDVPLENGDWPKRTWDVWIPVDGGLKLVSTIEELGVMRSWPGMTLAERIEDARHLLRLPVARSMPKGLRLQLEQFVR